jgi:Stigma-specific protein, Stig1
MSGRFEDLSRAMAEPTSRRNALKMLGAATAGAVGMTLLKPFRGEANPVVCTGPTTVGASPCGAGTTPCGPCCCKGGIACHNASTGTCGCPAGTTTCGFACCDAGVACASAATSTCNGAASACLGGRALCGNACCAVGQTCCGGACVACASGSGCCGGACAPLNTTSNCGTCGNACVSGSGCCGGACAPLNTTSNCGTCGNACVSGNVCASGTCAAVSACVSGTDPETGSPWVVCQANATEAWVSANNGGTYHAQQICQQLGYASLGQYGGTCGNVCGYCQGPTSCSSPGNKTFDGGGNEGTDAHGQIIGSTVQWQCLA